MGLFDDVLTANAPHVAPNRRGLFDDVLGVVRAVSSAALNVPFVADRAVKSELVRLGQASQSVPSFQSVAPQLGAVVRQPLERLGLPTGVTAGFAPGTTAGNVTRDLERQAQDVTLAAAADLGVAEGVAGLTAGTVRMVGRGISRLGVTGRVQQALQMRRILQSPVEELVTRARTSGDEAADILGTLRRAQSPKFRPVFEAVQQQRQAPRRPSALLISQRGAVPLPDIRPGDFVRFGQQVRRVVSVDPKTKQAILAVAAGRTIAAPLAHLQAVAPKQAIRETTGQAAVPPAVSEPQALRRSLKRQASAAQQGFQAGKQVGQAQQFAQGQQVLLRRSLAGQGRAFRAGEQAVAKTSITPQQSLARQGTAFEAGLKRGSDTQKAQLVEAFRQQTSDIKALQTGLIQRIRERVPMVQRGKFLSMVTQAQTKRQVVKAFTRIEQAATTARKRELAAQVFRAARQVSENPSVAVEFRQQIQALAAGLRSATPRPATLRRLEQTRAFLARQRQAGKDVELPKAIIEKLKVLQQAEASSLSVDDLERLSEELTQLEQLGRTKQIAREAIYQAEKDRHLTTLISGTTPLERHAVMTREPGGPPLTRQQQAQNLGAVIRNQMQAVDLAITPQDVIFDLLDGGKGTYDGANFRTFKSPLDADYSQYLDLKDAWVLPLQRLSVQLQLTERNFERIALHAYRVQPKGMDYLRNSGLSDAQVAAIQLTPAEQQWYGAARQMIEEPYPQTVEYLRVNANRALQKVPNYWPVQTDFNKLSDVEVAERLADAYEGFRRQKNVEQGFTMRRVGGRQPIRLNALLTFEKHMDDVAYLLSAGRDIKLLTEVARNPRYLEAAGELGQQLVLNWLDVMARKGGIAQAKRIPALDVLRKNFGASRLGFKLSSILIQPTALFDGAARLGPGVFTSFNDVIVSKPVRQFLKDAFPELRHRGADDPAYLELSDHPVLEKYQRAGFWALQQADAYTASAIVWEAYKQAAIQAGVEVSTRQIAHVEAAIEAAQLALRRTQASPFFKDLPLALSRGALTGNVSLDKAILQFKSFMLNRWSLIRHDAFRAGVLSGNPRQGAQVLFWLTVATIAETGVRYGSKVATALLVGGTAAALAKSDEEIDGWTDTMIQEFLGNVPFLGDLVSIAVYGGTPIPALGAIQDIAKGTASVVRGKRPTTKLRGAVKALEGLGGITGIPGISQGGQIIRQAIPSTRKKKRRSFRLLDAFSSGSPQTETVIRRGGLFDDVLRRGN